MAQAWSLGKQESRYFKLLQVLNFSAYFQEAVVEDPNENYRIRKCTIYYYLEDDTVHILEPKIANSGIP